MANNNKNSNSNDNGTVDSESSPLLEKQVVEEETKNEKKSNVHTNPQAEKSESLAPEFGVYGLTANGLPLTHGSVMGEPMGRTQWDSSLCACLGRNDEFCSSDLEVCLLGSMAPCVLYGSNVERLGSAPGTFANHCLPYTCLYLIGNAVLRCNFLAPCFSYPSRTAIRKKFNLEGSFEALNRSCGCCGSCVEDDMQREQCESACDFANHFFCHRCALCQEGRELRRRLPPPGFNAQPVLVMIAPGEQTMGRRV
ncbi:cell number regulator 8-like [Pistacia vera]|uniref:cell number regulator 8-like n=1 Tax=Pistacia vera TaxID=55513 RepID=UPI001262C4B3|nr:cell number regulator 8-like [Pistacia vera]